MFMKLICIIIILVLNSWSSRISANINVNDRNENFMKLLENTSQPLNLIANDLIFLSELPLDKLLKVKKSIEEILRVKNVDENEQVIDKVDDDDDDDEFEDGYSDRSRNPLSKDVGILQQRNIEGLTALPLVNNPPYNRYKTHVKYSSLKIKYHINSMIEKQDMEWNNPGIVNRVKFRSFFKSVSQHWHF